MSGIVRRQLIFSGHVQGVGFRYRAKILAGKRGLTGSVTNLWDGRVQMEVQGEEEEILSLIADLQKERFIQIHSFETLPLPLIEKEKGFWVR